MRRYLVTRKVAGTIRHFTIVAPSAAFAGRIADVAQHNACEGDSYYPADHLRWRGVPQWGRCVLSWDGPAPKFHRGVVS